MEGQEILQFNTLNLRGISLAVMFSSFLVAFHVSITSSVQLLECCSSESKHRGRLLFQPTHLKTGTPCRPAAFPSRRLSPVHTGSPRRFMGPSRALLCYYTNTQFSNPSLAMFFSLPYCYRAVSNFQYRRASLFQRLRFFF